MRQHGFHIDVANLVHNSDDQPKLVAADIENSRLEPALQCYCISGWERLTNVLNILPIRRKRDLVEDFQRFLRCGIFFPKLAQLWLGDHPHEYIMSSDRYDYKHK